MNEKSTQLQELEPLALDILTLSRNTLLVNLRFLEPAVYRLPFCSEPESTLSTDGFFLYYGFLHILKSYRIQKELVNRDLLHTILHCIFHHPFIGRNIDSVRWDLACDIAVEAAMDELCLPQILCPRTQAQAEILHTLSSEVSLLTAENLYHYFGDAGIPFEQLLTMREPFFADEHGPWYEHSQVSSSDDSSSEHTEEAEQSKASEKSGGQEHASLENSPSTDGSDGCSNDSDSSVEQQMLSLYKEAKDKQKEEEWEEISDQIQTDLETFSRKYGKKAGLLLANLKAFRKKVFDYTDFLRQFAVLGEETHLNDEEFDYIYYTYGLNLYDNVPLIEPLEYRESKKIREFVIAIDTSASVQGTLVQMFLQKTYEILKQEESFFETIVLYLIQCNTTIQETVRITEFKELDDYLSTMKLHGFGGTDFRPVFEHVEHLRKSGQLTELKGLLYFTDGFGEYPAACPDYPTAFILVDSRDLSAGLPEQDPEQVKVPSWAIKVILSEDSLSERKENYEH